MLTCPGLAASRACDRTLPGKSDMTIDVTNNVTINIIMGITISMAIDNWQLSGDTRFLVKFFGVVQDGMWFISDRN